MKIVCGGQFWRHLDGLVFKLLSFVCQPVRIIVKCLKGFIWYLSAIGFYVFVLRRALKNK